MADATVEATRARPWTALVLALATPFTVILCLTLWRSPYPLTEAVAIFENVTNTATNIWIPDTPYTARFSI